MYHNNGDTHRVNKSNLGPAKVYHISKVVTVARVVTRRGSTVYIYTYKIECVLFCFFVSVGGWWVERMLVNGYLIMFIIMS